MSDTILLVFEGEKTEVQIFNNLKRTYFGEGSHSVIHATYSGEIYQLWKLVKDDEYLDLVEILRERNERNRTDLEGIERDHVSQIFLFFDYDGHATGATDEKIEEMLAHFSEETENGKLYISYPMVEALKDLPPDFQNRTVPAKKNISYKQMVGTSPFQNIGKISPEDWTYISSENLKKANFITTRDYELPDESPPQGTIFDGQLENYIQPNSEVAVLSGIPFFIVEYFGAIPSTDESTS